jgi:hypothetical protein
LVSKNHLNSAPTRQEVAPERRHSEVWRVQMTLFYLHRSSQPFSLTGEDTRKPAHEQANKTPPVFAGLAAATGKQRKIPFVQAIFLAKDVTRVSQRILHRRCLRQSARAAAPLLICKACQKSEPCSRFRRPLLAGRLLGVVSCCVPAMAGL